MAVSMEEEAKAVSEVAKTAGQGIQAVSDFSKFVAQFIGGPLQQVSGMVEDHLWVVRQERRARLSVRLKESMAEFGMEAPTRRVEPKIALPILQAASYEEDDELQDMWVRLLVNAANADREIDVTRSLVSILQDFGTLEVQILNVLYSLDALIFDQAGVFSAGLPDEVIHNHKGAKSPGLPAPRIEIAMANLARHGCVLPSVDGFSAVYPTTLGRNLYNACTFSKTNL